MPKISIPTISKKPWNQASFFRSPRQSAWRDTRETKKGILAHGNT